MKWIDTSIYESAWFARLRLVLEKMTVNDLDHQKYYHQVLFVLQYLDQGYLLRLEKK
jgi:hypothetical protein